jgi:hypothetical protein
MPRSAIRPRPETLGSPSTPDLQPLLEIERAEIGQAGQRLRLRENILHDEGHRMGVGLGERALLDIVEDRVPEIGDVDDLWPWPGGRVSV